MTLPRMRRFSVQVTCLLRGPRVLKKRTSHRHSYEHTKVQFCQRFATEISTQNSTLTFSL